MSRHSNYLNVIFDNEERKRIVNYMCRKMKKLWKDETPRPDFLAARGVSGITIASILSYKLDIPLIVVRKPNEQNHAIYDVEGMPLWDGLQYTYWIVDDFVCTGTTIRNIISAIASEHNRIVPTGIIQYNKLRKNIYAEDDVSHEWFMSMERARNTYCLGNI